MIEVIDNDRSGGNMELDWQMAKCYRLAAVSLTISSLIAAVQAVPLLAQETQQPASTKTVRQLINTLRNYGSTQTFDIYQLENKLRDYPSEAGEALVDVLDTNDATLKERTSQLLQRISSNSDFAISSSSVKTIIGILKATDDINVQIALLSTLGNIGPKDPSIKQTLIDAISKNREVRIRREAIQALARLAREEKPSLHKESTQIILNILKNDDAPAMRAQAAEALSAYQDNPAQVVPALTNALDDNYLTVRSRVVQAMARYGKNAESAIPKLLTMLHEESDESIRSTLVYTIQSIDSKSDGVVTAFIKLMDDPRVGSSILGHL
ncbi:MAG: HEAT repeat domain-containing protein, partial [Cyanobacteria bacterium]|nr:HEAT repeat domain-containing protein [Cyanobacteriota bacterium]